MFQKTKKYKAERCPFFVNLVVRAGMSTLPKFRPKSKIFGNFGGNLGDLGWQGPPKVTCRHPGRLRDDFFMIFDGLGPPFRVPGGALWGTFWCMFCEIDLFKPIFRSIFSDSEKGAKTELPKGG